MQDYRHLDIWHRAMAYAVEIYRFSEQLPDGERYNLTSQLRKAATSVPLNSRRAQAAQRSPNSFGF